MWAGNMEASKLVGKTGLVGMSNQERPSGGGMPDIDSVGS